MKKNNILKISLLLLFGILTSSNVNSARALATDIDYKFTIEDFENNIKAKKEKIKNQDGKSFNPFVDFFILRIIEKDKDYTKEVETFNDDIIDILSDIEFYKIQENIEEDIEKVEEVPIIKNEKVKEISKIEEETIIQEEIVEEKDLPKTLTKRDILLKKGLSIEEIEAIEKEEVKKEEKKEETIEVPKVETSPTSKQITDKAYNDALNYLNNINIDEVKSKLGWNKIMCIGDSLTEGVQSGVSEPFPNSWPGVMGNLLNIAVENNGIGGSTIWSDGEYAMCDRISEYSVADAIFIMGGTNDWFFGYECPMGDKGTPNTFTYDVNKLFNIVSSKYKNSNVFVILPLNTNGHAGVEPYEEFDVLRNIEKTLALEYGFNIIDLPGKGMFNPMEKEVGDLYFSDFCHLNTKGYEMLGTIITAESISMVNK